MNTAYNILILSAGRRVSLLLGFKEALTKTGLAGQVFAADAAPETSSACHMADENFTLPYVNTPDNERVLLQLCQRRDIKMVVPTIDTELAVLAGLKPRFKAVGIDVIVSDPEFVAQCRDKRNTHDLFKSLDVRAPVLYDKTALKFPNFVKPYDGSLSVGAQLLESSEDLTEEILQNPRNIFCEYVDHETHDEFTVDLYYDRNSMLKCVVPRQRVQVRGGEVAKGLAIRNEIEPYLFKRMGHLDGAYGCLTLQLFRHAQTKEHQYIEINPRFGGGYPLSRHAGADFQSWLLQEYALKQDIAVCEDWRSGTLMLRYDAEVIVENYDADAHRI